MCRSMQCRSEHLTPCVCIGLDAQSRLSYTLTNLSLEQIVQNNEGFKLKGSMTAVLIREDGTTETRFKDNIIVNVGFDFVADAIGKAAGRPGVMSHIAVGQGVAPAAPGDSALGAELARVAATYAHTAGTKVFTFQTTFAAGVGTGPITEAGVVNAAAAGILLDRVVFAVINKGVADTLQVTFSFTMS